MKHLPKVIITVLILGLFSLISCNWENSNSKKENSNSKKENIFGIYESNSSIPWRYYLYPDSTYINVRSEMEVVNSEFEGPEISYKYDISNIDYEGNYTIIKQDSYNVLRFKDKNFGIVKRYKLFNSNKSFYRSLTYNQDITFNKIGNEKDLPVRK